MNGRYFDGRKLEAEFYDGFTNYFVPETDEEKEERDRRWEKWLEGNEEYEERIAAEEVQRQQNEGGPRDVIDKNDSEQEDGSTETKGTN
jgi:hypothetical protein